MAFSSGDYVRVLFQSLIGFKINWNCHKVSRLHQKTKFQSLIGFKINWNHITDSGRFRSQGFQSLIGFKINWNFVLLFPLALSQTVSIPNRV